MTQPPPEGPPPEPPGEPPGEPPTPPILPDGEKSGPSGCVIALAIVGGLILLLGGACFVFFAIGG